jgi:hypothetical protein
MKSIYSISMRKIFPILLLLSVLCLSSSDASAQAYAATIKNYINTPFNTGFTSIQGQPGTNFISTSNGYYVYSFSPQSTSLPFNFIYDSVSYNAGSTIYFKNNGSLSFTSQAINNYDYGYSISNNEQTTFPDFVNAWGMVYYPYYYSYGVYSQVVGPVGSRVWTLEYANVGTYYSAYTVSVQIKLYETTNIIEFWYAGNNQYVGYGYIGDIGLNGAGNGNYTGYNTSYHYFSYSSAIYTPSTQLRFIPPQVTNIQLSVQPKVLSFGSLQAGTTSPAQCLTVKNVGTFGALNITTASITGNPDFSVVSSPSTTTYNAGDPAGQYCITFTPTTAGIRSATFLVASNGKDSGVQTVNLVGIGTVADYTIDSLIRFKKTRTRLGDSLTQYLHITSTGQNPFFISSFAISGNDAGQYYISHYPVNPLAPGQSDSIGITYVPTIEGRHIATLTLLSNSFFHPTVTVSLQGTGILPHIVLTPSLLLFDSTKEGSTVCKTIDVWNPGSDTLRIEQNFLSSNDGDFHYTPLTGSDTSIAPDHHKTLNICFTPVQQGYRQARLLLKTNIIQTFETPSRDTASILTVDIRGTGVPFGVFATAVSGLPVFDSAIIGTQVCRNDTLFNNGDADIMVTGLTFTGGVFVETGLPATPFVLRARTYKVFNLCGTPNVQGLTTGTLTFNGTTSSTAISSTMPLGVFGLKSCVSATPNPLFAGVVLPNNGSDSILCVSVINCGDIPSIYTPTISGKADTDYSFTPAASGMIAKGDTAQFCIKYKPSNTGVSNASFDVKSSDKSTVSVPLAGADGCALVAATTDPIPTVGAFDTTGFFNITINNTGSFDWTPGTIPQITVTPNTEFTVISVTTAGHAPNQQVIIKMRFESKTIGNFTAKVTFPNAGPCGNVISVDLSGTIITGSVKETTADGFSLDQTYPNPTQGNTNFTYTMPSESEVRITLVDLTGRLVRTLITGRVSQGEHLVNFDISNLPSGTYMYVLESGSTRLVRQLILTR